MLKELQDNHLSPLDQLFYLNREVYSELDSLKSPIIVVGGQAVSYWLEYFAQQFNITDADRANATSVDVDYCGSKEDFFRLTDKWKVQFNIASIDEHTPEIGNSLLKDKNTHQIKEIDGLKFVDIGAWIEDRDEEPNQVDLLLLPAGFTEKDFKNKRLEAHTAYFEFPDDFELTPHANLRILNPVGCIKSRMLNYRQLKRQKNPEREIERIKALIVPTSIFLQTQLIEHGYKKTRKFLTLLMKLSKSHLGMEIRYRHGIDLAAVVSFVVEAQRELFPPRYISEQFPRWQKGIEKKFERKLRQYSEMDKRTGRA